MSSPLGGPLGLPVESDEEEVVPESEMDEEEWDGDEGMIIDDEGDGEDDDAECRADDGRELRERVPRFVGRRELDVTHGGEDERERGGGDAAGDFEHDAEVAGDEGNCK